jgi:hypothetical protein
VATSKPATRGQDKTGQWTSSDRDCFYPAEGVSGKSILVRHLLGPQLKHVAVVKQPI